MSANVSYALVVFLLPRLLRPLFIHRIVSNLLHWLLHTPIVGGILARVLSPIFAATGFKGRNPVAEVLSYYEAVHMDFPQVKNF